MDMTVEPSELGFNAPAPRVLGPDQLLGMLRRHMRLIGALALVGGATGYLYASMLPKSYTSSATLAVEGDRFAIPELQGALRDANAPDPFPWVRTEVETLTSRALIQQAVNQLDLVHDPEFNPALRHPSMFDRVKGAVKSLVPQHAPAKAAADPNEAVLVAASHALTAFQDNRSLTIDLSFTARDPALAARFVNTLIEDYLDSRRKWHDAANLGANTEMTRRIAKVRGDLDGIEAKITALRTSSGVVGLRSGSVGQQQLEELATAADTATLDRAQVEANWNRANALAQRGDSAALSNVLQSDTVSRLRDQQSEAARQVADLSATHGANYPPLRAARSDLASISGQVSSETSRIVQSLGTQLEVARAHEAAVKQELADARDAAVRSQNVQSQLDQLEADATAQRQIYQNLLAQSQQVVQPNRAAETPDVRVLSSAVPSGMPSAPNTKMAAALGLVAGAVAGALLALILQQREDGYETADAFQQSVGFPAGATLQGAGGSALASKVLTNPSGAEAETMRLLRSRLRALARSRTVRSVTFTGSAGDATAVALAFARVAAADGEHVLLAEGNLAKPQLGDLLGQRDGTMHRVLNGDDDWRDAVRSDGRSSMDVLTSGQSATDPLLLSGVTLQNLLMEARDDYTLTVLVAPQGGDAAAAVLAQRTDATVLVIDGRRSRRATVREQIQRLTGASRNALVPLLVLA